MTLKSCFRIMTLLFLVLATGSVCTSYAEDQSAGNLSDTDNTDPTSIIGIRIDQQPGDEFTVRVLCSGLPTYTMYELFDPLRIVLDIADISISKAVSLPLNLAEGPISRIQGQTLSDNDPAIVRLEMLMAEHRSYSVEREKNDIVISFPREATMIRGVDVETSPTETRVFVRTDGKIREYYKEELRNDDRLPARMYIDIKNVSFDKSQYEKQVDTSLKRIRMARQENGVRIVFDSGLPELFSYDIVSSKEGLEIIIQEAPDRVIATSSEKPISEEVAGQEKPADLDKSAMEVESSSTQSEASKEKAVGQQKTASDSESSPANNFAFSGYTRERITIDFYKIDLHNVFRLFGELSGLNIVVDEGVSGSLTLALNNVPWDFALDIIMNLKDLQKEERFNTLVISPKTKNFQWPERQLENLAVKAGVGEPAMDSLTVTQKLETSKEVLDAKKLMMMGRTAEKKENYEEAVKQYEEAFAKWPENGLLAKRLASLYLVNMGMNAKAVHYAKEALKIDGNDHDAALFAAIGLANMKKDKAAQDYFDLAVSGDQPTGEALISYAVFSEEKKNFVSALLLLARYDELYGDALETMVAKARIYDKEGNTKKALAEYQAILLSGYELPPDLSRFIKGRLALDSSR